MNLLLALPTKNCIHSPESRVFHDLAQEAQFFSVSLLFLTASFFPCPRQVASLPKAVSIGKCLPQAADYFLFLNFLQLHPLSVAVRIVGLKCIVQKLL